MSKDFFGHSAYISLLRHRGRRGSTLSLPLPVFSNPSGTTYHLPYILRCKTQGRRIILSCVTYLFFPPIARRYPVILRDTTGGGVSYFCSTIVFNPLALRALPLYSLTETQGERIERGILCFGIRIVLCISLLLLHDTP